MTSVAWGGQNLDELYVTTGGYKLTNDDYLPGPENGALYRITGLGTRGFPASRVRLAHI